MLEMGPSISVETLNFIKETTLFFNTMYIKYLASQSLVSHDSKRVIRLVKYNPSLI